MQRKLKNLKRVGSLLDATSVEHCEENWQKRSATKRNRFSYFEKKTLLAGNPTTKSNCAPSNPKHKSSNSKQTRNNSKQVRNNSQRKTKNIKQKPFKTPLQGSRKNKRKSRRHSSDTSTSSIFVLLSHKNANKEESWIQIHQPDRVKWKSRLSCLIVRLTTNFQTVSLLRRLITLIVTRRGRSLLLRLIAIRYHRSIIDCSSIHICRIQLCNTSLCI